MSESSSAPSALDLALSSAASTVEAALDRYLPPASGPASRLGEAVRHSLGGGKFVRPMLVRMAAETFGLPPEAVTPAEKPAEKMLPWE